MFLSVFTSLGTPGKISCPPLTSYGNSHPTLPQAASDYGTPLPLRPNKKKTTHITRNRKNKNFAIPADAAAIPPNPSTAAISAIIRKVTAQLNTISPPCYKRIASTHNVGCKALLYSCSLI